MTKYKINKINKKEFNKIWKKLTLIQREYIQMMAEPQNSYFKFTGTSEQLYPTTINCHDLNFVLSQLRK